MYRQHGSTNSKAAGMREPTALPCRPHTMLRFGASMSGGVGPGAVLRWIRPRKHTTSSAHFPRELKQLGDVGRTRDDLYEAMCQYEDSSQGKQFEPEVVR